MLFIHCLSIRSRRNILKARLDEHNISNSSNPENTKELVKILEEGEAYDEYDYDDYDDEDDHFDPWDLDDEEIEKRLRKLVNRIDNNDDGRVTEVELVIWTFKSLHSIDMKENSKDDFDDMDENEDDFATWDEFVEDEYGEFAEKDIEEHTKDLFDVDFNRQYNRVKSRFLVADSDKNGKLDLKEFETFKNPFHDEIVKDAWLEKVLEKVDLNNNGYLEKSEFDLDWERKPRKYDDIRKHIDNNDTIEFGHLLEGAYMKHMFDVIKKEDDQFHRYLDTNSNGILEGPDLLLWLSPDNADLAWEEVEELFGLCDEDEDGVLSIEEIIEEMDMWIDSDATEYGEQLRAFDEL